jgi:hypothetical protein
MAVCRPGALWALRIARVGDLDRGWFEGAEKADGQKARETTVGPTLGFGHVGAPHRHPGPGFGYVIEGEHDLTPVWHASCSS